MKKSQHGFTLVELVTIIILIGILAVNVLPTFDGSASYEAHSHRAQLISALRLTQQRAMQQTDPDAVAVGQPYCHQVIFDNNPNVARYGVPNRLNCNITSFAGWQPDATGFAVDKKYQVSFDIDGKANPSAVTFDSMGRPIANASPSLANNCLGGCTINVHSSVETLEIRIESEGYIHAN